MNKKVFIVLLLVVFMLAQFSMASAAAVSGDASITSIPAFLPLKQNPFQELLVIPAKHQCHFESPDSGLKNHT